MSLISLARRGRSVAVIASALLLVPVLAEARPGGGKGAGMVYVAGQADHKVDNTAMIDHIVALVEERARTLREAKKD